VRAPCRGRPAVDRVVVANAPDCLAFWVWSSQAAEPKRGAAVTKGSGAGTPGERQFFCSCVGRIPAPCPHAARHSPGRLVQPDRGFSVGSPLSNAQPLHRAPAARAAAARQRADAGLEAYSAISQERIPRGLASRPGRSWFASGARPNNRRSRLQTAKVNQAEWFGVLKAALRASSE
jgi:hypothetical protein